MEAKRAWSSWFMTLALHARGPEFDSRSPYVYCFILQSWPSWSKALCLGRSLFGGMGSNPIGCNNNKKEVIRDGVVGNISPCHGDARGSIPRRGGSRIQK